MTARPADHHEQHDLIHLGGETAVVVPMDEYRRLKALESRASQEDLDVAEADAIAQAHRGSYRRLIVGRYRTIYEVDDDVITIERAARTVS